MPTTAEAVTLAALKAELAELEAAAISDAELVAAVDKANTAFRDAGQPLVVADLAASIAGDDRALRGAHSPMTPAQLAAMIPPERRDEFLARLDALLAGLHRG